MAFLIDSKQRRASTTIVRVKCTARDGDEAHNVDQAHYAITHRK